MGLPSRMSRLQPPKRPPCVADTPSASSTVQFSCPCVASLSSSSRDANDSEYFFRLGNVAFRDLHSFDARQRLIAVEGRWRRQRPFERSGTGAPWIGGCVYLARECVGHTEQKHEQACERNERAD